MKTSKKSTRFLRIQLFLAVFMVIFGCLMTTAAFILPPSGEIHASVLAAFGEILTIAGAILGIDYNYKSKIHRKEDNDESD